MSRISALLVANRGEIARRIFRTARAVGLRCIAVYVEADAAAPFVTEADDAVRLPGGYLDGAAVLDAARASGADAIHPGYGFLSENARFASMVQEAGLVWVGPPPSAIEVMGDKLAAKEVAVAAGVPTLPVSDDLTDEGIGYPLLVKAAVGGGGKGMRVVASPAELDEAVASARREAASSFGDGRVFLERYVGRARHVEVQILGDAHGALVHLGERECSIQRRHQKIVEESPSPAIDSEMRREMGAAALRLAEKIGYTSTGTVEFLVDDETREFFFLEVNTRLQVEHAVTEMVTGIDLVREQLRVAAGEPLGCTQEAITPGGHAIEARLYAEDPAAEFLPAAGTLAAFVPADVPDVRWDSGVETGTVVGVEFDPMLAKVIAHAPSRDEATRRLVLALERLHIGGVTTNRDFLVSTLRSPEFARGETTTDFIERVRPSPVAALPDRDANRALAIAALWLQGHHRASAEVLAHVPSGWRNGRLPAQRAVFELRGELFAVDYRATRDGSFSVTYGGGDAVSSARIHRWSSNWIDLELGDRRARHSVTLAGERLFVQLPSGTVDLVIVPRFRALPSEQPAGALTAPMPGVVIDVRVEPDQRVGAGDILLVLEAMKMEHHIRAPADGVVSDLRVAVGDQVTMGTLLLVLDAEVGPSVVAEISG